MSSQLRTLYLGVDKNTKELVRKYFYEVEEINCESKDELHDMITDGRVASIHMVIATSEFAEACEISTAELAQTLRMVFRTIPIYFVSSNQEKFDRVALIKNGFIEAFILPLDKEFLGQTLAKAASEASHQVYTPVRLVDIEPSTRLNFELSIFLPKNNRFITHTNAGDVMDPKRLSRLKEYSVSSVYVPAHQVEEFYSYSARRLRELSGETAEISETERQDRLRASVRELTTGMLSDSFSRHISRGREVVEHSRNIVKQFILLGNPGDWYMRLHNEVGKKGDSYSHTGSVATYAALFSILFKSVKTEDVAVAGLFHDLGIARLSPEIQQKRPDQMTPVELEQYKKHPLLSLEVVRERKLVLPDQVYQAIAQHHECWNGQGYPNGLLEDKIRPEAQVLAIADHFDYLTRVEVSVSPMSADQAIRQIGLLNVADPKMIKSLGLMYQHLKGAA